MAIYLKLLFTNYLYIGKRLELEKAGKFCPLLKGSILDIGCGSSPYKKLLDKDSRYFSMEYQRPDFKPNISGDVNRLPFKDGTFDAVMFNEVIEHLPDPGRGLQEISRVLKKDGKLFMTAPMYWRMHYDSDYFRFTRQGLRYLLENSNFHIQVIERMGGFFSIMFIRLIDIFVTKAFFKFTDLLRLRRGRYRLAALLTWPFSLAGYYLGKLLDNIDRDDAFLWAALAVKK